MDLYRGVVELKLPKRRLFGACALVGLLGGCSGSPPADGSINGSYQHRHQVFVFHGSEPTEVEVIDRLTLSREGNELTMDLTLYTMSGETCSAQGRVKWAGPGYRLERNDKRAETGDCDLRLVPKPGTLVLRSAGSHCGEILCGGAVNLNPGEQPLTFVRQPRQGPS